MTRGEIEAVVARGRPGWRVHPWTGLVVHRPGRARLHRPAL